jgi:hypothetical protein
MKNRTKAKLNWRQAGSLFPVVWAKVGRRGIAYEISQRWESDDNFRFEASRITTHDNWRMRPIGGAPTLEEAKTICEADRADNGRIM